MIPDNLPPTLAEKDAVASLVERYRERPFAFFSWVMRWEPNARAANAEDKVTPASGAKIRTPTIRDYPWLSSFLNSLA